MAGKSVGVGLSGIIKRGGKVLLGLRKGSHGSGTWAFPGGHLEFGESWEDCIMREVEEETGLKIGRINFVTATNDIFDEDDKHYVTLFVDCEYLGGEAELREPDKCAEWRWFDFNSLPGNLMVPLFNLLKGGYRFDDND